jgi:hypothetical protein
MTRFHCDIHFGGRTSVKNSTIAVCWVVNTFTRIAKKLSVVKSIYYFDYAFEDSVILDDLVQRGLLMVLRI